MPEKIPRSELIDEIDQLAELLGDSPTQKDMETYGQFSLTAYNNEFGSWNAAVQAAGHLERSSHESRKIPKSDLLSEFERLGNEIGRTPTADDMDEYGNYSSSPYLERFDSWTELVSQSTLEKWEMPSGEDHPAWKGGDNAYYGANWHKQRKKALNRDDRSCQSCGLGNGEHVGKYGHGLHVHHIIPISEFDDYKKQNALSNLITLCQPCHSRWEGIPLRPDS